VLAIGLVAMTTAPVAAADHQDIVISISVPGGIVCVGTIEDDQTVGQADRPGPNATVTVEGEPVVASEGPEGSTVWVSTPSLGLGVDGPVTAEATTPSETVSSTTVVDPVSVGVCIR
jgi:hypothetical protein